MPAATEDERASSRSLAEDYAPGSDRPLAGYAALMGLYGAAVTAGALALRGRDRPLPEVRAFDIALVGVATHKLARRMSKDSVTSPLRAPFTRYEGVAARPSSRSGSGARASARPSANWSAAPSASASGSRRASSSACWPLPGRPAGRASVFASLALADFLQFAYAWAEQQAQG